MQRCYFFHPVLVKKQLKSPLCRSRAPDGSRVKTSFPPVAHRVQKRLLLLTERRREKRGKRGGNRIYISSAQQTSASEFSLLIHLVPSRVGVTSSVCLTGASCRCLGELGHSIRAGNPFPAPAPRGFTSQQVMPPLAAAASIPLGGF